MEEKNIERKVKEVLAERLDIPIEKIRLDSDLENDLGMDSFEAVELIFYIKEKFDIEIPEQEFRKIYSVKDIVQYLKNVLNKTS